MHSQRYNSMRFRHVELIRCILPLLQLTPGSPTCSRRDRKILNALVKRKMMDSLDILAV